MKAHVDATAAVILVQLPVALVQACMIELADACGRNDNCDGSAIVRFNRRCAGYINRRCAGSGALAVHKFGL